MEKFEFSQARSRSQRAKILFDYCEKRKEIGHGLRTALAPYKYLLKINHKTRD